MRTTRFFIKIMGSTFGYPTAERRGTSFLEHQWEKEIERTPRACLIAFAKRNAEKPRNWSEARWERFQEGEDYENHLMAFSE